MPGQHTRELSKYHQDMFGALGKRLARASRTSTARNAAEGTYETLRHAVLLGQPSSQAEAERLLLEALARRRSWRRLNAHEFECRWLRRTAQIAVPQPFDATALLRLITDAEVTVFLGDAPETELPELYAIAQRELQRLLDRDSQP